MTAKVLSADAAVREIRARAAGGRVFLTTGPAEPLCLHEAWRHAPETADGLTFCGLFIPGVNRLDYSALHPGARMAVFMLSPDWRDGFTADRVKLRPRHYSDSFATLVREGADVGVFQVSPPNAQGRCSFGPAADSGPAMLQRVGWRLGVFNRATPVLPGAPSVNADAFDAVLETDCPLADLAAGPPPGAVAEQIATHAAAFVEDGATVQTGIGKLPLAATLALRGRRNLRIHSGLIAQPHLDLVSAGAVTLQDGAITTGIAVGDAPFYAALRDIPIDFVGVDATHSHARIAAQPRFTALNAALEIDLLGQINAESAGGRQISGTGGLVDFVRGARASDGGRAIVLLQAEGRGESRIVPMLTGPVTIGRADAPILVTEFGAVDLAPLDLDARAEALITVAAPDHRAWLTEAWRDYRRRA